MRNPTGNDEHGFSDEIPTMVEQVLITKKEYEWLKRIAREGEASRIRSRNRSMAVILMILAFTATGIYMYVSKAL